MAAVEVSTEEASGAAMAVASEAVIAEAAEVVMDADLFQ